MSHPIPYDLAFTLHAHSSDVRNLCVPSPGVPLLLSGSRDGSACVWGPPSNGGREWDVKLRVEGPEKRFISCTGMVRSNGEGEWNGISTSSPTSVLGLCPRVPGVIGAGTISCRSLLMRYRPAFLLAGSSNGVLSTYALPSSTSLPPASDAPLQEPHHTLIEHKQNLCCMDTSKGGLVASGSWDK